MFYLGKILQLSGMVTLAWALMIGVQGRDSHSELILLAVGAAVFVLGSFVLRRAGNPG